ncbi:MAG: 16S rRNA (cytosine(1402)-N(4))-methyltransferase RsmH [Firmicutes bacterium]|nr:16S rRNA (cytosine(1402)-N(4))-methyltransferase RsmH [Bacillota bacterium]
MNFHHVSVLFKESIDALAIQGNGIYVDATLGGGGHTYGICEKLGANGKVLGIDQDINAVNAATKRLEAFKDKVIVVNDNFKNIKHILEQLSIVSIDGVVMDLGVSSHQLDAGERGFSYQQDAPLDMRMDRRNTLTACHVVNEYSEDEISAIIHEYGEEKWAKRIAKFIIEERKVKTIAKTGELVEIIKRAIPAAARREGPHPAKRTFQAIRIEVNNELGILKNAIKDFVDVLRTGGRMAVITFHSLEDRIVKQTFKELGRGCKCPPKFPVCVCGGQPVVKVMNRKPVVSSDEELKDNPRARSAKLRIIEKL